MRDRMPIIVDEVTTLVGPGELIDVVVTERGIAINPLRQDLIDRVNTYNATTGSSDPLPLKSIEEIKSEVERLVGGPPAKPELLDNDIAIIKWVDGTVIDVVKQVT